MFWFSFTTHYLACVITPLCTWPTNQEKSHSGFIQRRESLTRVPELWLGSKTVGTLHSLSGKAGKIYSYTLWNIFPINIFLTDYLSAFHIQNAKIYIFLSIVFDYYISGKNFKNAIIQHNFNKKNIWEESEVAQWIQVMELLNYMHIFWKHVTLTTKEMPFWDEMHHSVIPVEIFSVILCLCCTSLHIIFLFLIMLLFFIITIVFI